MLAINTMFRIATFYRRNVNGDNSIVDVNTVSLFKAGLGKFWTQRDVKYDFTADLTAIEIILHSVL